MGASEAGDAQAAATIRLPDDMRAWVEQVAEGRVTYADRQPGGGRKEAWFVDVERDGERVELFLRWDRTDPSLTGDPWTVPREAGVYAALQGTPVKVAPLLGVHPTEQAMLLERVEGRTWFSELREESERAAVATDFMDQLAALHRLDPIELGLRDREDRRSLPELVLAQLDELGALVAFRGGTPEPMLALALDHLRRHVPTAEVAPRLIQGDTGPGNFMYADGRVVVVVDWELAHLGDPMDDLAWITLRSVQEDFGDLAGLFARYAAATGTELDPDRLRYYRLLAEAKILTMNHRGPSGDLEADGEGRDVGAGLIFGQLHRRLCAEALADLAGLELAAVEVPTPSAADEGPIELFDVVLSQLRDVVVPRISDPLAAQRTKGLARILKYLAADARSGPACRAAELDDLEAALGERPASVSDGRRLLAERYLEGALDLEAAFAPTWRRIMRDEHLLAASSGALGGRHYADADSVCGR
jgi:aminoglycoside phosphotransferase (APT) family kinase protein